VSLVSGRKIVAKGKGKGKTPGTFLTQVRQYLKEGRAIRAETTLNQPRDLGTGKELANLAAMASASRHEEQPNTKPHER
jgi:hypothetical protein